jgi:hypothetical protein
VSRLIRRLAAAVLLLAACVPPGAASAPAATASLTPGTCEYVGARFSLPPGFTAKETREPGEPLARVTIDGDLPGRHHILLDIIPRAVAAYGPDLTPSAVAKAYFDRITSSLGANWTDVKRLQYPGPKRTYPALLSVEPTSTAGIAGRYDNIILLYLPDDPVPGSYFYSFFWTDIHLALDPRAPVTALEDLVNGFTILASPVGAVSRGCG